VLNKKESYPDTRIWSFVQATRRKIRNKLKIITIWSNLARIFSTISCNSIGLFDPKLSFMRPRVSKKTLAQARTHVQIAQFGVSQIELEGTGKRFLLVGGS
jgi:hypothetical protein